MAERLLPSEGPTADFSPLREPENLNQRLVWDYLVLSAHDWLQNPNPESYLLPLRRTPDGSLISFHSETGAIYLGNVNTKYTLPVTVKKALLLLSIKPHGWLSFGELEEDFEGYGPVNLHKASTIESLNIIQKKFNGSEILDGRLSGILEVGKGMLRLKLANDLPSLTPEQQIFIKKKLTGGFQLNKYVLSSHLSELRRKYPDFSTDKILLPLNHTEDDSGSEVKVIALGPSSLISLLIYYAAGGRAVSNKEFRFLYNFFSPVSENTDVAKIVFNINNNPTTHGLIEKAVEAFRLASERINPLSADVFLDVKYPHFTRKSASIIIPKNSEVELPIKIQGKIEQIKQERSPRITEWLKLIETTFPISQEEGNVASDSHEARIGNTKSEELSASEAIFFRQLYEEFYIQLCRIYMSRGLMLPEAEDLAQQTFEKIMRSFKGRTEKIKPEKLVYAVARRLWIDYIRKAYRNLEVETGDFTNPEKLISESSLTEPAPGSGINTADQIPLDILYLLPEVYQKILILSAILELKGILE